MSGRWFEGTTFRTTPRCARLAVLIAVALLLGRPTAASGQGRSTPSTGWEGTWRGSLTNLPSRAGSMPVEVTMEIGPLPTADSTCATWRSTYREKGAVRGVKDYRLCRGAGADDLYVDEGGGLRLAARWIGEVLVSPFKYDSLLLISQMRLRGDVLEEEILTIDDRPAVTGALPLRARGIQRIELRRVDTRGGPG